MGQHVLASIQIQILTSLPIINLLFLSTIFAHHTILVTSDSLFVYLQHFTQINEKKTIKNIICKNYLVPSIIHLLQQHPQLHNTYRKSVRTVQWGTDKGCLGTVILHSRTIEFVKWLAATEWSSTCMGPYIHTREDVYKKHQQRYILVYALYVQGMRCVRPF